MQLTHDQLCALIPHAGSMCLLDTVQSWDQDSVHCTAVSHRDPASPLLRDGIVPAVCAVEFAAQAMAVHGGLLSPQGRAPVGFLASVRNLQLAVRALNLCGPVLQVRARCLMNNEQNQMYELEIHDDSMQILSGRAAVFLQQEVAAQ